MIVVESFVSVIIERTQIRNPYTLFPADPVIIFCGGSAKTKNRDNPPAINILIVVEKMEEKRIPITNIRRKITKELLSIIPGDPAVHLKALIQATSQSIRKISPGNTSDCCIPNSEKFHVYASSCMLKMERLVKLITEKAIIPAASN